MEIKNVSAQKEFDQLIKKQFNGLIIIRDTKEEINIKDTGKVLIDVSDSAQIGSVYGSAQIGSVWNNSVVTICSKNVQINKVKQNSILICYEIPTIKYKSKTVKIIKNKKNRRKL